MSNAMLQSAFFNLSAGDRGKQSFSLGGGSATQHVLGHNYEGKNGVFLMYALFPMMN